MLEVRLQNDGTINKNRVTMEVEGNYLTLYFSYETIIGFIFNGEKVVSENIWSMTTGKYLNEIEPDKKKRVSNDVMNEKLLKVFEKINYKI